MVCVCVGVVSQSADDYSVRSVKNTVVLQHRLKYSFFSKRNNGFKNKTLKNRLGCKITFVICLSPSDARLRRFSSLSCEVSRTSDTCGLRGISYRTLTRLNDSPAGIAFAWMWQGMRPASEGLHELAPQPSAPQARFELSWLALCSCNYRYPPVLAVHPEWRRLGANSDGVGP